MRSDAQVRYRMSRDSLEMRHLEGVVALPDAPASTESWLGTYIRPDDPPHGTRAIRDAVRARSTFEMEHRMRRADGSWGWVVSRAMTVTDQHGRRGRVVRDRPRRHRQEGDRGSTDREQESNRGSGPL
jgi:hypothetical protein